MFGIPQKMLDRFQTRTKIKIVGSEQKQGHVGRSQLRAKRASIRPYNMRIKRDHGAGLWTIEDDQGQLYLAVLSREVSEFARDRQHESVVRAGRR